MTTPSILRLREREADEGAANFLIPMSAMREFKNRYALRLHSNAEAAIRAFAKEIGVSPALVLARLQRDELVPYRAHLNTVFADKFSFDACSTNAETVL